MTANQLLSLACSDLGSFMPDTTPVPSGIAYNLADLMHLAGHFRYFADQATDPNASILRLLNIVRSTWKDETTLRMKRL